MKHSYLKKASFISSVFLVGAILTFAGPATAAAYLKIDGIVGECQDKDHKGWSDMLTFSQELVRAETAASRRSSSNVFKPIVLTKELDAISPKLMEAVATGKTFKSMTLHLTAAYTDAGRQTYYSYEFKNVKIIRYNVSGSGQSESVPKEEFALAFDAVKVTYTRYDRNGRKKGNVEYSWKK